MAGKLPTAAEIVKKALDRARQAPSDWEGGMDRARGTIVSGAKAANARYKSAMQAVLSGDLWVKGFEGVTDEQIIAAAKAVGGNTWLNGLTTREQKILAAFQILVPKLQAHVDKIRAMPNVTEADREKRMLENLRGMRALGL